MSSFITEIEKLPAVDEITEDYTGAVYALMSTYNNFSSYQKGLVNEESLKTYNAYAEKYKELTTKKNEGTEAE